MVDSTLLPLRRWFAHSAHAHLGWRDEGSTPGPYCWLGEEPLFDEERSAVPLRVTLVARQWDASVRPMMRCFEQAARECCNAECFPIDVDSTNVDWDGTSDADCVVLLGHGLRIARRWSDLDLSPSWNDDFVRSDEPMTVESAASAARHPVTEGVCPFTTEATSARLGCIPSDAVPLLIGRTDQTIRLVAWTYRGDWGRAFCTTLGSAADFRRPDFVRLACNALAWVGR
ncbi:MAG: ThuA domain-containing protein [Planctomycetaceae bacterium]|nr:ThuA domain-containing protein [Planctomycetaceae bacterium]